jgi:broad specificity phosphatase PhoE
VDKTAAAAAGPLEYGGMDVDARLTTRGIAQATETGRHLASKFRFTRVFTSPYLRTVETTRVMAGQFNYTPEITNEERIRRRNLAFSTG